MLMRTVTLYFDYGELTEVNFVDGTHNGQRRCIRGKSGGAYRSAGSFQWTSAVKALALLLVRARVYTTENMIRGEANSMAASLDYAISKQPTWLTEMFGCDQDGISLARRMILRTNPERKRPGPVTLGLNMNYVAVENISIILNGKTPTDEQLLGLSRSLECCEIERLPQAA